MREPALVVAAVAASQRATGCGFPPIGSRHPGGEPYSPGGGRRRAASVCIGVPFSLLWDPYFGRDPSMQRYIRTEFGLFPDGTHVSVLVEAPREMSEEEVRLAALADPDNLPLTQADFARMKRR